MEDLPDQGFEKLSVRERASALIYLKGWPATHPKVEPDSSDKVN
jgi:hypothetical protein